MIRVRTLLLALWAMQCLASHAGLIDQVGVELRLDDNLARAELDGDITSDSTLEVSADAGAGYQVSDSDRLKLSFELSASAFRRYDGLDHVAARVALTHRHKFGLGAYAPALALAVSASRLIYRDSARTGWQYEAGATLHKRFSPRVDIQAGYGFQLRRSDDVGERVLPQIAADVFDTSSRHLRLGINAMLTPSYLLGASYAIHKGDIVSTTLRNLPIFLASDAIAPDEVFGPDRFAYTLTAMTRDLQLSLSRLIGVDASMTFGYQLIDSNAEGGIAYRSILLRATYLQQF